jgi:hypothetical protein
VDFEYEGETHPATLGRYKQDETELAQYLLTRVSLNLPNGTILMIPDKDFEPRPWLVFWMESIQASGYNRYVVLRMTHEIKWKDEAGADCKSWCYLHGPGDSAMKETLKTVGALYSEDDNNRFVIMPFTESIRKEGYIEVGEGAFKEAYRVTGYDIHSTPGVEYVTLNPMYVKDDSPAPEQNENDDSSAFFWLNGGES